MLDSLNLGHKLFGVFACALLLAVYIMVTDFSALGIILFLVSGVVLIDIMQTDVWPIVKRRSGRKKDKIAPNT